MKMNWLVIERTCFGFAKRDLIQLFSFLFPLTVGWVQWAIALDGGVFAVSNFVWREWGDS